ncbi:MAG: peptidyl-prolyl cis-trans isomerase SurA [Alphaproteobacteria bacterium]|nr:peptidyl-prolyl cis-trans isomerase SurA [Alphaproteobacteria bacterium]
MIMTTTLLQRLPRLVSGCAATFALTLALMASATPSYAQSVAVMVNGEPITNFDIEQRTKLDFLSTHKQPTRQEVIEELIDQKVKIKEAKQFGVDPSSSDIDASFAEMSTRMRITPDQLSKSLESQGIRPDTLKQRIKADMVWAGLVRGRYKESLQVGEREVNTAAQTQGPQGDAGDNKDDKQQVESFEYKMQPIVLIVPRGSSPSAIELRRKDAETLRARVQTCDEANSYFKSMQNAAIREAVTKTSADIPAALRQVLDSTPIGHLTPPEVTKQGVEMVALCGRKPTTVDTPQKKAIRDKMFAEKFETKSKAYLAQIRKAAMIEYR